MTAVMKAKKSRTRKVKNSERNGASATMPNRCDIVLAEQAAHLMKD